MAFEKQMYYDLKILFLMLIGIPLIASTNIDCGGKSFHCLNSTHFMICVDLGGGVSTTVDDFVIPCPPPTVCLRTNRFECEFPLRTTPAPKVLPIELTSEPEITTQAWESIAVTTASPTTDIEQHLELGTATQTQDVIEATVTPTDTVFNTTDISENVSDTNNVTASDILLNETTAGDVAVAGTESTVELVEPVLVGIESTEMPLYVLTTENTLTSDVSIIPLETHNVNRTERSNITTDIVTEYNIVTTTENIITNTPSTDADMLNNYFEAGNVPDIKVNETFGSDVSDTTIITVPSTVDNLTSVNERVAEIVSTTSSEGAVLSEVTTVAFDLVNNLTSSDSTVSVTENTVDIIDPTLIEATTVTSDTVIENTVFHTVKNDTESPNVSSKSEVSVETVPSATVSSNASMVNKSNTDSDDVILKNDTQSLSKPTKPEVSAEPISSGTVSSTVSIANESKVDNIAPTTEAPISVASNNGISKNESETLSSSTKSNVSLEFTTNSTVFPTETLINESNIDSFVSTTEISVSAAVDNETLTNDTESFSISSKLEGSVETSTTVLSNTSGVNESEVGSTDPASVVTVDEATQINISTIPGTNTTQSSTMETTPIYDIVSEITEYPTIFNTNQTVEATKVEYTEPLITTSGVDVNIITNNTDMTTTLPELLGSISPNNVTTEAIVTDSTGPIDSMNEIKNSSVTEQENITPSIKIGNESVSAVVVTTSTTTTIDSSSKLQTKGPDDVISPETIVITESTLYFTTVSDTNEVVIDTVTEAAAVETTNTTELAEMFSSNDITNTIFESAGVNLNAEETSTLSIASADALSNQTTERGTDTLSTSTTPTSTTIVLEPTKPNVFTDNQVSQNNTIDTTVNPITNQETIEPPKVQENTTSADSHNQISNQMHNTKVDSELITKSSTTDLPIVSITDNMQMSTDNSIVETTVIETASSDITNWPSTQSEFAYEASSTTPLSTVSESNNAIQSQAPPSSDTVLVLGVLQNESDTNTPQSTVTPSDGVKLDVIVENIGISSQINQENISTEEPNKAVTGDIKEDLQTVTPLVTNQTTVTEIVTKADESVTGSVTQTLETVGATQSVTADNVITTESYDVYNSKFDDVSTSTTESLLAYSQTQQVRANESVLNALVSVDNNSTNPLENVLMNETVSKVSPGTTHIDKVKESVGSMTSQSTLIPVIDVESKVTYPLETMSTAEGPLSVTTEVNVITSDNILIKETTEITSTQLPLSIVDSTLLKGDGTNVNNTNKSASTSINVNPSENVLLDGTSSVNIKANLSAEVTGSKINELNSSNNEGNILVDILLNGTVASISTGSSVSAAGSILVEVQGNISGSDSLKVGNNEYNLLENVLLNTTANTSSKGSAISEIRESSVVAENAANYENRSESHIVNTKNQEMNPLENLILNGTATVNSKGLSAVNENGNKVAESNVSNPLENILLNGTNAGSISVSKSSSANGNESNPLENLILNRTLQTSSDKTQLTNEEEVMLLKNSENPLQNIIFNETVPKETTLLNVNESALPESKVLGSTIVSISDGVVTIQDQQYSTSIASDVTGTVEHTTATEKAPAVVLSTSTEPLTISQGNNGIQTVSTNKSTSTVVTETISGNNVYQSTESNVYDETILPSQDTASSVNPAETTGFPTSKTDSLSLNGQSSTLYIQESIYTTSPTIIMTPKTIIKQTVNVVSSTKTVESTTLSSSTYPTTTRQSASSPNSELNNSHLIGSTTQTAIEKKFKEINIAREPFDDVNLRIDHLHVPVSTTTSVYDKESEGYLTSTSKVLNETEKQTSHSQLTTEKANVEISLINNITTEQTVVPGNVENAPITVVTATVPVPTAPISYKVQTDNLELHSTTSPVQTQVTSKTPIKVTPVNNSSSINVNTDKVTDSLPSSNTVNNVVNVTTSLNIMTNLSDNDQQILHTDITNIFNNDDKITEEQNINSTLQPNINVTQLTTQEGTKIVGITSSPSTEDRTHNIGVTLPVEASEIIITRTTAQPHVELERKMVTQVVNGDSSTKPTTSEANSGQVTATIKPVFDCQSRPTGRYADNDDCRKFYICSGITRPITGMCPVNTVFSEIRKQCTKNLSHCIRRNEFKCVAPGRFSDYAKHNVYYICVQKEHSFLRYKMQCQNGYHLNRATIRCYKIPEITNQLLTVGKFQSTSEKNESISENNQNISEKSTSEKDQSTSEKSQSTSEKKSKEKHKSESHKKSKSKSENDFECEEEGKFPQPDSCRRYYVCSKSSKTNEFRRKLKKCDSDEVFHKKKKKCVDEDSYECP